MEEKNFLSFMEFLRILEAEDLKGMPVSGVMKRLASPAELTDEQKNELAREFPGI